MRQEGQQESEAGREKELENTGRGPTAAPRKRGQVFPCGEEDRQAQLRPSLGCTGKSRGWSPGLKEMVQPLPLPQPCV